MAHVELAPEVAEDLKQILEHLCQHEAADVPRRMAELVDAMSVLESNPLMGRQVRDGLRELVIGREARGYIALYRYVSEVDTIFVLAVKSQREAGYRGE